MIKIIENLFRLACCFVVLFASYSVAVAGDDFDFEDFQHSLKNIKKSDIKYNNIVINRFSISKSPDEIDIKDKPKEFTATTEAALLGILEDSNLFDSVSLGKTPNSPKSTLVVKAELTKFRKVSARTRRLLGFMAGHSYMELKTTLIDAETGKVIIETTVEDDTGLDDNDIARSVGEKLSGFVVKHTTISK